MTSPYTYKHGYPPEKYSLAPVVVHGFDPTSLDVRDPKVGSTYRIGTLWVNNSTNQVFVLASIVANSANWIDFVHLSIDAIVVEANDPPGTNPVVPDVSNQITIVGIPVANHGKPIETRSREPNKFNIELQYSKARTGAPANPLDAGISSYNDTQFTVDGNAYVSLVGPASLLWQEVTTTPIALAVNTGYVTNSGSLITLTLPVTAPFGSVIRISGKGSGLWLIAQNANQRIHFGALDTTVGVSGSLAAGGQFDTVELLCDTANLRWTVLSSTGSLIVT